MLFVLLDCLLQSRNLNAFIALSQTWLNYAFSFAGTRKRDLRMPLRLGDTKICHGSLGGEPGFFSDKRKLTRGWIYWRPRGSSFCHTSLKARQVTSVAAVGRWGVVATTLHGFLSVASLLHSTTSARLALDDIAWYKHLTQWKSYFDFTADHLSLCYHL